MGMLPVDFPFNGLVAETYARFECHAERAYSKFYPAGKSNWVI